MKNIRDFNDEKKQKLGLAENQLEKHPGLSCMHKKPHMEPLIPKIYPSPALKKEHHQRRLQGQMREMRSLRRKKALRANCKWVP